MSHARAVWFGSKLGLLIDEGSSIGIHKWWKQNMDPETSDTPLTSHDPKACMLIIWWAMWKARNDFIFLGLAISLTKILNLANKL